MTALHITEINPHNPVTVALCNWITERIQELREENDQPELGAVETARIRGSIAGLKEVASLLQPEQLGQPSL